MYLENNQFRRHPMNPVFAWSFAVLWMLIIFLLSAQDGTASGQLSGNFAAWVYKFVTGLSDPAGITVYETALRSLAHGGTFFILALFVGHALGRSNVQDIRNTILTLVICAIYAGTDEWHQSFVPGRACELADFAIDMVGVVIGVVIYQAFSAVSFLRGQTEDSESEAPE